MPGPRYLVGIDLGTTNTVVAYTDRQAAGDQAIRLFDIEQLVALGEVAARPQLPSLRYHPAPDELALGDIGLPWASDEPGDRPLAVLGELARELGGQVPGRLVASAKSWLSHRGVDRTAPILPWGAGDDVAKISPLDASASYLAHVRAAWNHRFSDSPLETQEVMLTVPASFDEGARALTVEAARQAGIPRLHLLEEPQAAFYDWLFCHQAGLNEALSGVHLVLICDVGGGTTDLTLIKVEAAPTTPRFSRIGVGDHLMLGGDNMDLGLAHLAEGRLAAEGTALRAPQLNQLVHQCRLAKQRLLESDAPESAKVTVLGAGAQLVGAARSAELKRGEVRDLVLDGFFPRVGPQERPQRLRGGFVEFGLPYAPDPAVTRQVAAFLARHIRVARKALGATAPPQERLPVPDAVLLNGGVFRSRSLTERLQETLSDWRGTPVKLLANAHPEWAVARGAVAYGLARTGMAPRIGGGSARSYFLALEDQRGICLLPRQTQEGRELVLPGRTFALRVGQPVRFHLHSSTADTPWQAGDLVELDPECMLPLPPIAVVLETQTARDRSEIPVQLAAMLTEVGTLDVQCVATPGADQRWRLEFQLRGQGASQGIGGETAALHPRFAEAAQLTQRIFGRRAQTVQLREVKSLRGDLEKILGGREKWDTVLLRELFSALWDAAAKRRRSAAHERVWFNLVGYSLRPGFGYPLDDWRVRELWSIYRQGVQFVNENRNWAEWWILWRRAAGGLEEPAQIQLLDDMSYYLRPRSQTKGRRAPGPKKQGYEDMVRLAASLERLPMERKSELGAWFLERLAKPRENPQTWWALGRLGARELVYASAHQVVQRSVAEQWLERLLAQDWKRVEPAAFATALIARRTGDRERDLSTQLRDEVVERLRMAKTPHAWVRIVREVVALDAADQRRLLGDSLPQGLRLLH
jgi:molecular chaperone DnaK (HSP70)